MPLILNHRVYHRERIFLFFFCSICLFIDRIFSYKSKKGYANKQSTYLKHSSILLFFSYYYKWKFPQAFPKRNVNTFKEKNILFILKCTAVFDTLSRFNWIWENWNHRIGKCQERQIYIVVDCVINQTYCPIV